MATGVSRLVLLDIHFVAFNNNDLAFGNRFCGFYMIYIFCRRRRWRMGEPPAAFRFACPPFAHKWWYILSNGR